MKSPRSVASLLILVLLVVTAVPAIAQGPVNVSIDGLEMNEAPQSRVMVTVRDANGVPVIDLGVDKFEIVEDGRASFPPSEVTAQVNRDAVISVVMVIDISGSMDGKPVQEAMRAANALLDQLSPDDRAAIIAFADEVKSLDPSELEEGKELGFTTDKNAVRNVVNFLDTKIGWDTPLYDAIYKGVKMISTEPAGKRAVVVMTDGKDERDNAQGVPVKDAGSLSTPDDPIHEANRYNVPIFSIGLGTRLDTKYLQRLAERTGGVYQQAPQPEELTPLFENVVSQLKTQYLLAYESRLERDSNYHSLMVRVTLPQGQDFDETKFQIIPSGSGSDEEMAKSADSSVASTSGETGSIDLSSDVPSIVTQETPPAPASGVQDIIDTIRDTVEDQPTLAIVIGAGIVLLLILIVALVVVLLRGRGAEDEEYAPIEFEESYSPAPPPWRPTATDASTPMPPPSREERTEVAPGAWGEPGADATPFSPVAGPPGAEIPAAGGTRIIERGPKHLAMLVDRSQPDHKYDLRGTTNIGRASDNQVVLNDPTVSRHHAWIKAEEDSFLIFDVGSANGTFVNDEQIEEPRQLQNGDAVRFGDAEFVFTKVF